MRGASSHWSLVRSALLGLLLLGVTPVSSGLSISGFQNDLVNLLLGKLSIPGQFDVRADSVDEVGTGRAVLIGLHISDANGEWFRASRFVIEWSPTALLGGEARIDQMTLKDGHLLRLPSTGSSGSVTGSDPSSVVGAAGEPPSPRVINWPRSPIALTVGAMRISNMRVASSVLPGGIAFDAVGSLRDRGDQQSLTLVVTRVDDVVGTIDVQYRKRFDDNTLILQAKANEGPSGLVAALAGLPPNVPVRAALNAKGPPSDFNGTLDVAAQGMLEATGNVSAAWAARVRATLELRVTTGQLLSAPLRAALGNQARLNIDVEEGDDRVVRIRRGALIGPALQATLAGTFDRADGNADLTMDVTADNEGALRLAELTAPLKFSAARLRVHATGGLESLRVRGDGELRSVAALAFNANRAAIDFDVRQRPGAQLDVRAHIVADKPQGPSPTYAELLGDQLTLTVKGTRLGNQLRLKQVAVQAKGVAIRMDGSIALDGAVPRPDLRYVATIEDLGPLVATASLDASGRARAAGTVRHVNTADEIELSGKLTILDGALNGQRLGDLQLDHTTRAGRDVAGTVSLEFRDGSFGTGTLDSSYRLTDDTVELRELNADLLGLTARGSLSIPGGGKAPSGEVFLAISELGSLARLTGVDVAGRGNGHLVLDGRRSGSIDLQATLHGFRFDGMTLKQVGLDIAGHNLTEPVPRVERATLKGAQFRFRDLRLETLSIDANGKLDALALAIDGRGQHERAPVTGSVRAIASADAVTGNLNLDVKTLRVDRGERRFELAAPTRAWVAGSDAGITDFELVLPENGRISGDVSLKGNALLGRVAARSVLLGLLDEFNLAPVTGGFASGHIDLNTHRDSPALDARLSLSAVTVRDALPGVTSLAMELNATWDGRHLNATSEISGPFEQPVRAELALPLVLGEGIMPAVPSAAAVEGLATWHGEVARLFELVPAPEHLVSGVAELDMRFAGPLDGIRASGNIRLSGGRYENLLLGTIFEQVSLNSQFENSDEIDFVLTANDGLDGTVRVDGRVDELSVDPRIEINLTATDALVIRLDTMTAMSSAELAVRGHVTDLSVTGNIAVRRANIALIDAMARSVIDIGEVLILGEEPLADETEPNAKPVQVSLDVTVDMPRAIFVNGRGLNSEWGGALSVGGTIDAPVVEGGIKVRRGTLDFLGKAFEVERGLVTFNGAREFDPALDVRFTRRSDGLTGYFDIGGRVSQPSIKLSSVPALPADEVLPRLLFGRARQSISATQAVQLAAGLQALASGRAGTLDKARAALGLDVLRVEGGRSEGGSASLSVGRYVSDKVYVGARQGFDGKPGSVVVEIEVRDNLLIDATVGQEADSGLGISWRKDF
jgi:translocation and assembly module TamB